MIFSLRPGTITGTHCIYSTTTTLYTIVGGYWTSLTLGFVFLLIFSHPRHTIYLLSADTLVHRNFCYRNTSTIFPIQHLESSLNFLLHAQYKFKYLPALCTNLFLYTPEQYLGFHSIFRPTWHFLSSTKIFVCKLYFYQVSVITNIPLKYGFCLAGLVQNVNLALFLQKKLNDL